MAFVLRHIETGEFVCLRQGDEDWLAAFSDPDSALTFRDELGMLEFVDVETIRLSDTPFSRYWLDGQMVVRPAHTERPARSR